MPLDRSSVSIYRSSGLFEPFFVASAFFRHSSHPSILAPIPELTSFIPLRHCSCEFPSQGYLFPGRRKGHLSRQAADLVLRQVCEQLQLKGASTHRFRWTGITKLHDAGVPLWRIQARTGHVSLGNLALYVDVRRSEVDANGKLF